MSDSNLEEESIISQDDIDKLLDSSFFEEETPETGEASPMGGESGDLGELSQEDIDSLLGGNDPIKDENADLSQEDEEIELISQDDIDRLMNASAEEPPLSQEKEPDPQDFNNMDDLDDLDDADELITMDDIQGLMDETKGKNSDSQEDIDMDDRAIDESEAMDVSQCLITQETIDHLIQNAPEPPVILDSGPEIPLADPMVPDQDTAPDPISMQDPEPEWLESLDDFEDLLGEENDLPEKDPLLLDGDDVSQEDIDALLQDSDANEDFLEDEDDMLISQDDIDTLLMAADQEDEDIFGDITGDDMDADLDDDETDISSNGRGIEIGSREDHVVLERVDDSDRADQTTSQGTGKPWYKSRLVVAAASAILVMGISIPSLYFLFFSHDPVPSPEFRMVPVVMEEPAKEVQVIQEDIAIVPPLNHKNPGQIVLTDFLVLASDLSKDMVYVTLDISIDYSDQRAYHEISSNLSFYRDLIYESIQKNLVWEKRNEVTEADLVESIHTMLKKVLPPDSIDKVSFQSFKAS